MVPIFPIDRLIPVGLNLAFTVIGAVYCYAINKIGDNKDFIARMICLGWPIGIRAMMITFLPWVLIAIILTVVFPSEGRPTFLVTVGWFLRWWLFMCILAYFGGISDYLRRIAGAEKALGIGEAFSIAIRTHRQ